MALTVKNHVSYKCKGAKNMYFENLIIYNTNKFMIDCIGHYEILPQSSRQERSGWNELWGYDLKHCHNQNSKVHVPIHFHVLH